MNNRTSGCCLVVLGALLCSGPALAERGPTSGASSFTGAGAMAGGRASTTDWRRMTSGTRADEAFWRNFWRPGRADIGVTRRDPLSRTVGATAVHDTFGREVRDQSPNILTGTNQRIDILTGRLVEPRSTTIHR